MTKNKLDELLGVGRRKRSVASVRLRKGTGQVKVNGKEMQEYFPIDMQRETVVAPLKKLNLAADYDVVVRVSGGGIEGQAVAARLGISRALVDKDEDLRKSLKDEGYLTRDPRMKERKKYGRAKARKQFQFSKR